MKKIIWILLIVMILLLAFFINKKAVIVKSYFKGQIDNSFSLFGHVYSTVIELDKYYKIDSLSINFNNENEFIVINKEYLRLDTTRKKHLDNKVEFLLPEEWSISADTLGFNYYSINKFPSSNGRLKELMLGYSIAVYDDLDFISMSNILNEMKDNFKNNIPDSRIISSSSYNTEGILNIKFTIDEEGLDKQVCCMKAIHIGGKLYYFSIRTQLMYYPYLSEFMDILLWHVNPVDVPQMLRE